MISFGFIVLTDKNRTPTWNKMYDQAYKLQTYIANRQSRSDVHRRCYSSDIHEEIISLARKKFYETAVKYRGRPVNDCSASYQSYSSPNSYIDWTKIKVHSSKFGIEAYCETVYYNRDFILDPNSITGREYVAIYDIKPDTEQQQFVYMTDASFGASYVSDVVYHYTEQEEKFKYKYGIMQSSEFVNYLIYDRPDLKQQFIVDKIKDMVDYTKLMRITADRNDIQYTMIYDTLRQKLVLCNIFLQRNKDSDIDITIPYFIDEIQSIGQLVSCSTDSIVRIKLSQANPVVMTSMYEYQVQEMDRNMLGEDNRYMNRIYSSSAQFGMQKIEGHYDEALFNIFSPDQEKASEANIDLDLTDLEIAQIDLDTAKSGIRNSSIANQIVGENGSTRISYTDAYQIAVPGSRIYNDRIAYVTGKYPWISKYVTYKDFSCAPWVINFGGTLHKLTISNRTVQNVKNLNNLLYGVSTVILKVVNDTDASVRPWSDMDKTGMLNTMQLSKLDCRELDNNQASEFSKESERSTAATLALLKSCEKEYKEFMDSRDEASFVKKYREEQIKGLNLDE